MAKPVLLDPRFFSEQAAFDYVESHLWPNGPVCPYCHATAEKIGRLEGVRSKSSRKHPEGVEIIGLRKCYACRRSPFTVRKGTIFEDSHLPLRLWLQAIHLLCASKKGMSTRQLQRMLGCGMKTAWHLGHRVREIMQPADASGPLGGEGKTIEADVTYVGRKPMVKAPRGGFRHMNPVLSLIERGGGVRSAHVPSVHVHNLAAALENRASPKSDFMTDEAGAFREIGWNFRSHQSVNHSKDEYARSISRQVPM